MKVQSLRKMKFTKATIAKINKSASMQVKGGTRTLDFEKSGYATHCKDIVCY